MKAWRVRRGPVTHGSPAALLAVEDSDYKDWR
jgi:hypothetical protein